MQQEVKEEVKVEAVKETPVTATADGAYLFTTSTCPNCKIAKEMLAELDDFTYEVVDAQQNPELAKQHGIMQAPTLVIIENGQTKKYANASNIQKFVEENE